MPLISINPVQRDQAPEKKSVLEQIALGVDIAKNVVGTGAGLYKTFGPEGDEAKAKTRLYNSQADSYADDKALDRRVKESTIVANESMGPLKNRALQGQIEGQNRQNSLPVLTAGEKSADDAFGKDYVEYKQSGSAQAQRQLTQLNEAIQILSADPKLTGGVSALAPKEVRDYATPKLSKLQEMVENSVNGTLKATYGNSFTEKEGKRVIDQNFNVRLPGETNVEKLKRVASELQAMVDAKNKMANHFATYGTLKGYQGPTLDALGHFDQDSGKSRSANAPSPSPSPSPINRVRVTDGNQTLEIDSSDLSHALQDGFRVVK